MVKMIIFGRRDLQVRGEVAVNGARLMDGEHGAMTHGRELVWWWWTSIDVHWAGLGPGQGLACRRAVPH